MNKHVRINPATSLNVTPLVERNGAPRHIDDKTFAIVKAAVESAFEEKASKLFQKYEATNANLERAINRLLENIEGVVLGEHDLAVAAVVDTEKDDLPRIASFNANPTLIYRFKAKDIAASLGLTAGTISYLLNANGLNWATRKPDLWDHSYYKLCKARLWHPSVIDLLREVILDPNHPERVDVSSGCENSLRRAAQIVKR